RHIEIQVFADTLGHVVHLGERDCTAQRRRQKVVEEAPSPVVSPAMRAAMGADAVAAALAVGYAGAGTVEFVVDTEGRHFFLEMNTRLQVEHPVTECITGLDLVEWQLRVAAGEPLPLAQEDIRFSGHAIEARLYAEDPCDGWKPQTGRIVGWRPERAMNADDPAGSGIRIDHGIHTGGEVTPWYDAMVAKVVAHGRDRADAVRRLTRALEDAPLFGLRNNGRFLRDLLNHPQFTAAQLTTTRLDEWAANGEPLLQRPPAPEPAWRIAAAVLGDTPVNGVRPASVAGFDLTLDCEGERRTLRAPPEGVTVLTLHEGELRCTVDGVHRRHPCVADSATLHLAIDAAVHTFTEVSPFPAAPAGADPRRACAPVAGTVAQVLVAVGDAVVAGQPLVCVEAMKMELWLHAAAACTVQALHAQAGQPVAAGALLVALEITA
ncbi:MAG TPA: biotin/lipoyl-containing protein, partial [Rubrivivax sp.]|nr:biotin/lipoyl-containing protein [Rubrivivax sp.]